MRSGAGALQMQGSTLCKRAAVGNASRVRRQKTSLCLLFQGSCHSCSSSACAERIGPFPAETQGGTQQQRYGYKNSLAVLLLIASALELAPSGFAYWQDLKPAGAIRQAPPQPQVSQRSKGHGRWQTSSHQLCQAQPWIRSGGRQKGGRRMLRHAPYSTADATARAAGQPMHECDLWHMCGNWCARQASGGIRYVGHSRTDCSRRAVPTSEDHADAYRLGGYAGVATIVPGQICWQVGVLGMAGPKPLYAAVSEPLVKCTKIGGLGAGSPIHQQDLYSEPSHPVLVAWPGAAPCTF